MISSDLPDFICFNKIAPVNLLNLIGNFIPEKFQERYIANLDFICS